MHRGYLKLWRKIEDSVSWSRGLEYRGLICSILVKTSRKKTAFRGEEIHPGQFGTVMSTWCDELGLSRQKLQRMSNQLVEDGFISVKNVGNRFSIISVLNWEGYQESKAGQRATTDTTTDTTGGQPVGNRRATSDTTEQEYKNLRTKNKKEREKRARVDPPFDSPSEDRPPQSGPKHTDCPSKSRPSRMGFMSCWQVYPVKKEQEAAWCEWCRLEDKGLLPEPWIIRERIIVMSQEDSNWKDGFAPRLGKWLNGKGWDDEPLQRPAQQTGGPPGGNQGGQSKILPMSRDERRRQNNQQVFQKLMEGK